MRIFFPSPPCVVVVLIVLFHALSIVTPRFDALLTENRCDSDRGDEGNLPVTPHARNSPFSASITTSSLPFVAVRRPVQDILGVERPCIPAQFQTPTRMACGSVRLSGAVVELFRTSLRKNVPILPPDLFWSLSCALPSSLTRDFPCACHVFILATASSRLPSKLTR